MSGNRESTADLSSYVPPVQAEMRQGLSYFHSTIFSSLPVFIRRIDTALKQARSHARRITRAMSY